MNEPNKERRTIQTADGRFWEIFLARAGENSGSPERKNPPAELKSHPEVRGSFPRFEVVRGGIVIAAYKYQHQANAYAERLRYCVEASPVGGGFVRFIPIDQVDDWDATLPAQMRFDWVGFSEGAVCKAYWNPLQLWNGWLKPLVDRENLLKFLAYCDEIAKEDSGIIATGQLVGDVLHISDSCYVDSGEQAERFTIQKEIIKHNEQAVEVWDISLGYCWEAWAAEDLK